MTEFFGQPLQAFCQRQDQLFVFRRMQRVDLPFFGWVYKMTLFIKFVFIGVGVVVGTHLIGAACF